MSKLQDLLELAKEIFARSDILQQESFDLLDKQAVAKKKRDALNELRHKFKMVISDHFQHRKNTVIKNCIKQITRSVDTHEIVRIVKDETKCYNCQCMLLGRFDEDAEEEDVFYMYNRPIIGCFCPKSLDDIHHNCIERTRNEAIYEINYVIGLQFDLCIDQAHKIIDDLNNIHDMIIFVKQLSIPEKNYRECFPLIPHWCRYHTDKEAKEIFIRKIEDCYIAPIIKNKALNAISVSQSTEEILDILDDTDISYEAYFD